MNTVEVQGLFHRYTDKKREGEFAVDDVSFSVPQGQFFVLLGPSGCGKTTTLRCIAGLERPSAGRITLDGRAVVDGRSFVPTSRRNIGMVFQDYAVWPHMTVFDNVAFPLTVQRRVSRTEVRRRVHTVLELVRLDHLADRHGTQLSGGQQQRVALARALVREPGVLLLDEPLSNLDAKLRERMRDELRQIQEEIGVTTMLVTHDQVEALSMASTIALMENGKVAQLGRPRDLYERPASRFVAEFIGTGTFLDGTVREQRSGEARAIVDTPLGVVEGITSREWQIGEDAAILVRPEHVLVRAGDDAGANETAGMVRRALYSGAASDLQIECNGVIMRATVPAAAATFSVGDPVVVTIPTEHAIVVSP